MFKNIKPSLGLFERLVAFLYMYKTMGVWSILIEYPWFFAKTTSYSHTSFMHLVLGSILYPVVSVGLWLTSEWGILLCLASMLIDAFFFYQLYYSYKISVLLNCFIYLSLFVSFCFYKLIYTYRRFKEGSY